jgi:hypothetical protein
MPNIVLRSRQTYATPDRITLTVYNVVLCIVHFIGDNGRTPHVLSAFEAYERCVCVFPSNG